MNNQILVNNIKKLCKENNVTISVLERELFMSPGLISRWTKNMPALDRVIEIANYFNVPLDTLIGNANDDKNNDDKKIERLTSALYNKSIEAEIEWQIFNPNNIEDNIGNKKISSILDNNMDCFFCNVNEGYFILTITHNEDDKKLSLYVLADQYSHPELKYSKNDKLCNLCNYLLKRYSKQLNNIKTNNFIDDFLKQESTNSNIAVLKTVVNE